jgi:molybdopterin/thiamine biosynthesis adenylyltransferase
MVESPCSTDLSEHFARLHARSEDNPPSLSLADERWLAAETGYSMREIERAALRAGVLPERYRRNLGTIGLEGQARLLDSTVAVVGAGGLGGWIIELLARMGVGRLTIIDGDHFQENNLNRQLGCTEDVLGRAKAEVLAHRARQVNGVVEAIARVSWLSAENADELLAGARVAVDALDTLPARYILQEATARCGIALVHGAIGGYSGQVMTILPGDPGLKALYGDVAPRDRGVEMTLGNPAATPMMIAAWQAHEVIKLLTGQGEILRHRMLVMDAESGNVTEIRLG